MSRWNSRYSRSYHQNKIFENRKVLNHVPCRVDRDLQVCERSRPASSRDRIGRLSRLDLTALLALFVVAPENVS